jgi:ribosomal protein L7/L12
MGLFGSSQNPAPFDARLRAIERKLDIIMNSLGLAAEQADMEPMRDLVRQGRKIEAIKLYREQTGAGLAEAKEAVDRLG